MKKLILLMIIPLFIGISQVSAEETGTWNTAPVAVDDTAVTMEDTAVEVDLTANDTDAEEDTLSVISISSLINWAWVINSAWTWVTFTPDENFNGIWSFTYIVSDWELTDTWSVFITVNAVNDAPVAVNEEVTTNENTPVEIDLVWNDIDVDWDELTVTSLWTVLNWGAVINWAWTWITFTPDEDFVWDVIFSYTVVDWDSDWSLSDEWTVLVHVVRVDNSAPVAVDDEASTSEDTAVEIDLTSNDTDADNDELVVISVSSVMNGEVEINWAWTWVTFTPLDNFNWTWSFDYTVSDWSLTDTASVVVIVEVVNDAPIAVNDEASTDENTPVEVDLTANDTDVDWDELTVTSLWTVLNWDAVINWAWTWVTFTPDTWFVWDVSFSYTVSDWDLTDTANVLITVWEVENSAPVAVNDTLITYENTSKTIDPRTNDTDADGDILDISWVTNWNHWTVTFTSVTVTYEPDENYYWSDSFTYTVNDWNWWTDVWTVYVSVRQNGNGNSDNNNYQEKFAVQNVQKEFISKFNQLKAEYKNKMWNKASRNEYLRLKKELRAEYLIKLKEVTWTAKKYSYEWVSTKDRYKNIYKTKYSTKIWSLSQSQLGIIIERIDNLITQINDWNYSETTKSKFNTMLLALRELVLSYMDEVPEDALDIDSLFDF